jgi:hypothetical protein
MWHPFKDFPEMMLVTRRILTNLAYVGIAVGNFGASGSSQARSATPCRVPARPLSLPATTATAAGTAAVHSFSPAAAAAAASVVDVAVAAAPSAVSKGTLTLDSGLSAARRHMLVTTS